MEVARRGEVLPDDFRANHLAVLLDQAAASLMRKYRLRDHRNHGRENQPREYHENQHAHDRRPELF